VAVGFVAMAPLLVAYEAGLALGGPAGPRNFAELLCGRPLAFLGEREAVARIAILAVLLAVAFVQARLGGLPLGRLVVRIPLEGAACGLALGPLLLIALVPFDLGAADLGLVERAPPGGVELDRALRAFGAGAWEELVFRVGAFSAIFVFARSVAEFLGASSAWGRWISEVVAALGSALAFAACHLDRVMGLVGLTGEAWDPRVFLWRVLAGLFLAALFRWRGPGVAAWCHGAFNLALLLGSGPGVFR
jgi:hypothetical protein